MVCYNLGNKFQEPFDETNDNSINSPEAVKQESTQRQTNNISVLEPPDFSLNPIPDMGENSYIRRP